MNKNKNKKIQIPKDKVETTEESHFPIVGIGASAGGLSAFEAFLKECQKTLLLVWLL